MSDVHPPTVTTSPVPRPVGAWEALLWTGAYAVSPAVAGCLILAVIAISALGMESLSQERLLTLFVDLNIDRSFLLIGISTLGAALLLIPLVTWRMGRSWREHLNVQLPSGRHSLLILASVLPLAILSGELYRLCLSWMGIEGTDTNQVVQSLSFQVSYPILVVAIAMPRSTSPLRNFVFGLSES